MDEFQKSEWQESPDVTQKAFRRDGYVVVRSFLDAEEVAEVYANLDRVIREVVPTLPSEQAFYEEKGNDSTLKQVQQLQKHNAYFGRLFSNSKFEQLAELLLDGPVDGRNMQYFNKPPLIGKATPPHQDGYYFMIKPAEAVTMWLAMDDVDEENGCVRYVHGSHEWGVRPHGRTQTLGFSQGVTDYGIESDRANEVALPAQPGDLLVHHCMTIHRADGNVSADRTRRALGFIYYSARAEVDEEAHAAYQKRLADEMKQKGRL
jgi:phytanoyl-CoA hydroxylase